MTAAQLISSFRLTGDKTPDSLADMFAFKLATIDNEQRDLNRKFRAEVVNRLLYDFTLKDIYLVRKLIEEELKCDAATGRHDNIYQLCFYLYELAQPEDIFRLYNAKFDASNFDVACTLDREMITIRHTYNDAISYIERELKQNPALLKQYPVILKELNELKKEPDSESQAGYRRFLYGYFYGHERVARINFDLSNEINRNRFRKPWWRFW